MSRRKPIVHFTHVLSSIDAHIAVLTGEHDAWIAEAIRKLPEWGFRYVEELGLYLVDPATDRSFTEAINARAKRDDRWCGPCVAWATNPNNPLCSVWEERTEHMSEFGFEVCHLGAKENEVPPMRNRQFTFPPVLAKIFAQLAREAAKPGSPANQFVTQTASPFLKEQLRKRSGSVFGVMFTEKMLDELLEIAFAAMRGEMPRAWSDEQSMTPAQAAEILGVKWPCAAEEVTAAFRKKARETHPDAHPDATEKERETFKEAFVRIGLAREVLMKAVSP